MPDNKQILHFFLGANTPQGFVSKFSEIGSAKNDWHFYIIKGGPGTGKSTFMKKAAESLLAITDRIELIHCSSDPNSLDAVIAPDVKIAFADGTAPHDRVSKTTNTLMPGL